MAELTRYGVAYDLKKSPYRVEIEYTNDKVVFVFSSKLYSEKFLSKLEGNRAKINSSLSNRFGFEIVNDKLSDIKLYSDIEKRGFLIILGEVELLCLGDIRLIGESLTTGN